MSSVIQCLKIYPVLVLLLAPGALFAAAESLKNPLSSDIDGISGLIGAIVNMFQIIAIPIIVAFIIYAGFLYVMARGNPADIEKANKALVYALIGAVIVIGAEAIGMIVKNTATEFSP